MTDTQSFRIMQHLCLTDPTSSENTSESRRGPVLLGARHGCGHMSIIAKPSTVDVLLSAESTSDADANNYNIEKFRSSRRRQTIGSTKVQPNVTPLPTQNQTNFKSKNERKAVKRKLFLSYDQAEGLSKTKLEEDPGDMIVGIQLWSEKRVPTIRVPNSRKVQIGTDADVQFL